MSFSKIPSLRQGSSLRQGFGWQAGWQANIRWQAEALLVILMVTVCTLPAQEPAARVGRGGGARGEAAAIAGAKEDPAAVERGTKLYATHCAGCHGSTGRG